VPVRCATHDDLVSCAGLSPARRRLVGGVLAVAVASAVAVTAAIVQHGRSAAVHPVPQRELGPVVLVPGYHGSTRSLEPMRESLRAAGRDVTVLRLIGDGTGDLAAQARRLRSVVNGLLVRTGANSVDVVGYSAGGVVARLWVRDDGGANQARRVVTLGTPNHGTDVSVIAVSGVPGRCPLGCQQLVPDSDLLRALNARDETPTGPRIVSIWSTSDEIVTPPDTARLEGARNITVQSVCPASTDKHADLPRDPVVLGMIKAALGTSTPKPPAGVRCPNS
jgi:triacylglycerol lipase